MSCARQASRSLVFDALRRARERRPGAPGGERPRTGTAGFRAEMGLAARRPTLGDTYFVRDLPNSCLFVTFSLPFGDFSLIFWKIPM